MNKSHNKKLDGDQNSKKFVIENKKRFFKIRETKSVFKTKKNYKLLYNIILN